MKPTGKRRESVGVSASEAACSSPWASIKQEVASVAQWPSEQHEAAEMAGLVWFSPAALLLQEYTAAICGLPIKRVHRANSHKQPKGMQGN